MSIYKENEVILSKDNKVFIVTKYIGLQCASCEIIGSIYK